MKSRFPDKACCTGITHRTDSRNRRQIGLARVRSRSGILARLHPGGRKLGSELVLELHRVLCGNLTPDLTILMDSEVGASVERARRRNQARTNVDSLDENRFERESRAFFSRVRSGYLEIAKREPQRVTVVDARGTPDQTHAKILQIVDERFGLLGSAVKARNVS